MGSSWSPTTVLSLSSTCKLREGRNEGTPQTTKKPQTTERIVESSKSMLREPGEGLRPISKKPKTGLGSHHFQSNQLHFSIHEHRGTVIKALMGFVCFGEEDYQKSPRPSLGYQSTLNFF